MVLDMLVKAAVASGSRTRHNFPITPKDSHPEHHRFDTPPDVEINDTPGPFEKRASITTLFDYQYSERNIIGPGISLEVVVMYHEERQAKHEPPISQDWNYYPPQYFLRDSSNQDGFSERVLSTGEKTTMLPADKGKQPMKGLPNMQHAGNAPKQEGKTVSKTSQVKAKRVRTGCLTCRERHLKCDEAVPDCMNCRKRGRECKRGIRLNFLDINVHNPACVPPQEEWKVQFLDESRDIASEYMGGLSRYAPYDLESTAKRKAQKGHTDNMTPILEKKVVDYRQGSHLSSQPSYYDGKDMTTAGRPASLQTSQSGVDQEDSLARNPKFCSKTFSEISMIAVPSSSCQSNTPYGDEFLNGLPLGDNSPSHRHSDGSSLFSTRTPATLIPFAATKFPTGVLQHGPVRPSTADYCSFSERDRLNTPEEIRYMQVFIQEVGIWLDSFNKEGQFSHLIPYYALRSTMILNAFLACGAKHLSFASAEENDKALFYHNTATSQLLRNLQNPDRNMAECATTAVILNVYEFMSEKPAHRMRHIGGARALILECRWNARSTGTGAACFWQNITMEILICLSTHWETTWDPEDWGLDLDFFDQGGEKMECVSDEVFVHRILFIMAKIVNFRASVLQTATASTSEEHRRLGEQLCQWQELQRLCDQWNDRCPRTMHSYGYMRPTKSTDESNFPCIWLIRRTAILGRLFYHTAQSILAQHHPVEEVRHSESIKVLRLHHAHQICGIVAHTKDGGVAPVAIRCLAIAASVLHEPREHAEVLEILYRIKAQSGWYTDFVELELKRAWGWERGRLPVSAPGTCFNPQPPGEGHTMPPPLRPLAARALGGSVPPLLTLTRALTPPVLAMTPVNPLTFADFSLPNHPYQNWYEPPNRSSVELKNV